MALGTLGSWGLGFLINKVGIKMLLSCMSARWYEGFREYTIPHKQKMLVLFLQGSHLSCQLYHYVQEASLLSLTFLICEMDTVGLITQNSEG